MKTQTIKQTISFNVSPHEVFEAIMDEKKHQAITGGKAKVSRKIGGKFEIFEGELYGKNIEITKDKKIVQKWIAKSSTWPKNHFSTLTFTLTKTKNGTKLSMTHSNIPLPNAKSIAQGWKDYYWKPMKEFFANK